MFFVCNSWTMRIIKNVADVNQDIRISKLKYCTKQASTNFIIWVVTGKCESGKSFNSRMTLTVQLEQKCIRYRVSALTLQLNFVQSRHIRAKVG